MPVRAFFAEQDRNTQPAFLYRIFLDHIYRCCPLFRGKTVLQRHFCPRVGTQRAVQGSDPSAAGQRLEFLRQYHRSAGLPDIALPAERLNELADLLRFCHAAEQITHAVRYRQRCIFIIHG
ncbi:hypothetical protein D3C73_1180030 [compost metagenome]